MRRLRTQKTRKPIHYNKSLKRFMKLDDHIYYDRNINKYIKIKERN